VDCLACVNVEALPLQLLLQREPGWLEHPVAVVSHERPQGVLLWVNERARRTGVKTGMTYAGALGLCSTLRAAAVSDDEIRRGIGALEEILRELTPEVEPSLEEPGVFWLNAEGLLRLWPSLEKWGKAVHTRLKKEGYASAVVTGFSRFGTYALACALRAVPRRNGNRVLALSSAARESELARKVPIDRLNLNLTADARDSLIRLGIKTVGAFVDLPKAGVLERFGPEAHKLRSMAKGDLVLPLKPSPPPEPLKQFIHLDAPERNAVRLLFLTKRLLHPLLRKAAKRHELVTDLHVHMELEGGFMHGERIRPAEPTRNAGILLELTRLRLEATPLPAGVTTLIVQLTARRFTRKQLSLFVQKPRRPLDSANRALARVRAEFGDNAVVAARLKPGHLPEARFTWEQLGKLRAPKLRQRDRRGEQERTRKLIRRMHRRPDPLPSSPLHGPANDPTNHPTNHSTSDPTNHPTSDPTVEHFGPYVVSGGWWTGDINNEVHREYHFVETRGGELLWVYYDRKRERWYLQGRVE
jgi:protein ImuB